LTILLPEVSLERVLRRVDAIWSPGAAPHHLIYGMTGSGKTTLIKKLLGLCEEERVLIFDPKAAVDHIWDGPPGEDQWGRPVTAIGQMFGYEGEPGGGPLRLWYRLTGGPDRGDTARRFAAALSIVQAEGHVVLVLDDVREICYQLGLAKEVDSILNLGRSANVLAVLSTTETAWVSGRSQGGMIWVGHTQGLPAARAGAELLGWRGKDRQDICGTVAPHEWLFSEEQAGSAGPCLIRGLRPPCFTPRGGRRRPSRGLLRYCCRYRPDGWPGGLGGVLDELVPLGPVAVRQGLHVAVEGAAPHQGGLRDERGQAEHGREDPRRGAAGELVDAAGDHLVVLRRPRDAAGQRRLVGFQDRGLALDAGREISRRDRNGAAQHPDAVQQLADLGGVVLRQGGADPGRVRAALAVAAGAGRLQPRLAVGVAHAVRGDRLTVLIPAERRIRARVRIPPGRRRDVRRLDGGAGRVLVQGRLELGVSVSGGGAHAVLRAVRTAARSTASTASTCATRTELARVRAAPVTVPAAAFARFRTCFRAVTF